MDNETAFNTENNSEQELNQEQSTSVFDQVAYSQMTQEQKFAASKQAIHQKYGVQENSQQSHTIADQVANDSYLSDRMTVHQDNSVTVKGNVLGNDKASSTLISHIRNEMYKKYGIEGND